MAREQEEKRKKRKRREKTRKIPNLRNPKPSHKEMPAEEADATSSDVEGAHSEEALAVSVSRLGAKPGSKAMDLSLSAFVSCPLQQKQRIRQMRRRTALSLTKTAKTAATCQMAAKR
jgi:hypothetical protein